MKYGVPSIGDRNSPQAGLSEDIKTKRQADLTDGAEKRNGSDNGESSSHWHNRCPCPDQGEVRGARLAEVAEDHPSATEISGD